ncbi:MAG: heparan-alpha-glucosaminide N-acetyltransferase domain-containing protein [Candidatus Hydrogenedentes bacterium]|nr:heparan-alpha-glucosaminide N-acetyltransferase domain-containing protein [Candidatus Hydrogenedentota bacterium]
MNTEAKRWTFIDQFRGFAIISMILVNVCNELSVSPSWLRHHDYGFTFADYVAPAFIFIVGFGYRLSLTKALSSNTMNEVHKKFIRRYCIITFLGFIYGHFDFEVAVWDALTDIGIAGLLMYPVMRLRGIFILLLGLFYLTMYQCLFTLTSYGEWVMKHSIDGGPLGPLSWAFILAFGAFYATLFEKHIFPEGKLSDKIRKKQALKTLLSWFILGCLISISGIFMVNLPFIDISIPFTQKGMTASYSLFSSGLCGISLVMFYLLNEFIRIVIPFVNTMGKNPLVLYFLQAILIFLTTSLLPDEIKQNNLSPYVLGFCIILVCYIVARTLEKKSIYIKV